MRLLEELEARLGTVNLNDPAGESRVIIQEGRGGIRPPTAAAGREPAPGHGGTCFGELWRFRARVLC